MLLLSERPFREPRCMLETVARLNIYHDQTASMVRCNMMVYDCHSDSPVHMPSRRSAFFSRVLKLRMNLADGAPSPEE